MPYNEEIQKQISDLQKEVQTLYSLLLKDEYSDLSVFNKKVQFNQDITFKKNTTKVRAFLDTSNQSINNESLTKVLFNAESFDTLGEFASNRFTATVAGYYMVYSSVMWINSVDGKVYETHLYKSGSEISRGMISASVANAYLTSSATDIVYLAVGNYIETFVYHNSGAARSLLANTAYTHLSISKLL